MCRFVNFQLELTYGIRNRHRAGFFYIYMKKYLKKINRGESLSVEETNGVLEHIFSGDATDAQIGSYLSVTSRNGETIEDVVTTAEFINKRKMFVSGLSNALDIVGTGGDSYDTINVSTLASLVCAAFGVPIAKHGTRALSSKCGSFDVLNELKVILPGNAMEAEAIFKQKNIVFLFAPNFHPLLKKIHHVRQEIGIRTIFNLVGPILNPGDVAYQVIGVSKSDIAEKVGAIALSLGRKRVLVMHGRDGLDEASVGALTDVYDFAPDRKMDHFVIEPDKRYAISEIQGGTPAENAIRFKNIVLGQGTQAENEFVAINAGLGLYAVGRAQSPKDGRDMALDMLKSGEVEKILKKITKTSL